LLTHVLNYEVSDLRGEAANWKQQAMTKDLELGT